MHGWPLDISTETVVIMCKHLKTIFIEAAYKSSVLEDFFTQMRVKENYHTQKLKSDPKDWGNKILSK